MLELLIAAALVSTQPQPEPTHLRRNEYGFVVDTPGNPELITFELLAQPISEYVPLEAALEVTLGDEPFEIMSLDPDSGRIVVRTTEWGGLELSATGLNLRVIEVSPRIRQIEPRCHFVMAHLGREDPDHANDLVYDQTMCPAAEALRGGESIIVVGLGSEGEQLWVTSSSDPRHHEWETFGPDGPSRTSWRNEDDPVWADLRIPVTDNLETLRWFEVTPDNELVLLGESEWRPVQQTADD